MKTSTKNTEIPIAIAEESPAAMDVLYGPILTRWQQLKYAVGITLWLLGVIFFWQWWLQPSNNIGWIRYLFISVGMGWIFFLQFYFLSMFVQARKAAAAPPDPATCRVAMIVTKTPSEPFSVLCKTLLAMLAQDYPHDTWLADEDPGQETIEWCNQHGVKISSRKGKSDYHRATWPRRTRCKEGNLAYFYDNFGYENYDFVAQLDADHVPSPSYLGEMLRPFADPRVGYVSAPSICESNAAKSWSARARLFSEAMFHGVLQA